MPLLFNALEIFLLAVGLAMDAFAVAVTNGMTVRCFTPKLSVLQGLYFGLFQFLMPLAGYLAGSAFMDAISSFDHWVAFALLGFIGGQMIRSAVRESEACDTAARTLPHKKLLLQAVATSIDALAVGISLCATDVNIFAAAGVIGAMAFILSFFGGILGKSIGCLLSRRAEITGGIILVAIGIKILIEHLIAG